MKSIPGACILDTWEVRQETQLAAPELPVLPPSAKIEVFLTCRECGDTCACSESCTDELYSYLSYSSLEIQNIEEATRGQDKNQNWHTMRENILTASNFHKICHSRNSVKTALSLLSGATFDDENLPAHIAFGQKYEGKGREHFMKSHHFHHRKCEVTVPGLMVSPDHPFLGASPDGVLLCYKCPGKSLIEIKCLSSKRNFQPATAFH